MTRRGTPASVEITGWCPSSHSIQAAVQLDQGRGLPECGAESWSPTLSRPSLGQQSERRPHHERDPEQHDRGLPAGQAIAKSQKPRPTASIATRVMCAHRASARGPGAGRCGWANDGSSSSRSGYSSLELCVESHASTVALGTAFTVGAFHGSPADTSGEMTSTLDDVRLLRPREAAGLLGISVRQRQADRGRGRAADPTLRGRQTTDQAGRPPEARLD
jgi:hypothetical protein